MAANDAQIPSVEDIQRDPGAVLARFRDEDSFAFSFGDNGLPEAVLLTYDGYEDLGGPQKFTPADAVLTPDAIQRQLPAIISAILNGNFTQPVLWSDTAECGLETSGDTTV
jgi:hypothetical protein